MVNQLTPFLVILGLFTRITVQTTWHTDYADQVYDYSKGKVQGVCLGGWLVLEPYITPSLFQNAANNSHDSSTIPVDEYHYCQYLGQEEASKRLERHWSTWIVEDDIKRIQSWGLNMVRLPVGYWQFDKLSTDPYVSGRGEHYIDLLISWCRKYNIKIWIDLHGVPGSQNGFDNSGLRDLIDWQKNATYVPFTMKILKTINQKYGGPKYYDVISGIQIVNEPLGGKLNMDKLKAFYNNAYIQYRGNSNDSIVNTFVIHDAFESAGYWDHYYRPNNTTLTKSKSKLARFNNYYFEAEEELYIGDIYYNILVDHHRYEVFDLGQIAETLPEHIESLSKYIEPILAENKQKVIGEWSAALTDCAPWLNGVGRGARYDGTFDTTKKIGSCNGITDYSSWSSDFRLSTRKLIEHQLNLYNQTEGWFFWCYKTENTIDWDMKRLVEYKLFPQPLDDRMFDSNSTDLTLKSFANHLDVNHKIQCDIENDYLYIQGCPKTKGYNVSVDYDCDDKDNDDDNDEDNDDNCQDSCDEFDESHDQQKIKVKSENDQQELEYVLQNINEEDQEKVEYHQDCLDHPRDRYFKEDQDKF